MHHTIDQITKTTNCAELSFFASRMSYFPLFSSKQDIRCIDAYLNNDLSHINKLNCVECLGLQKSCGICCDRIHRAHIVFCHLWSSFDDNMFTNYLVCLVLCYILVYSLNESVSIKSTYSWTNFTSLHFMLIQILHMMHTRVSKFYDFLRHLKKYKKSVGQGQQNQCM